jgi:hypothetical protein
VSDGARRAIDAYFPHAKDMHSNGPYDFHDHPWLDFTRVSDDGRVISLHIKFWTGGQFCCESPACRFSHAFFSTNWSKLHELLRREGVEPVGTIKFVVRVETESGAMFAHNPGNPDTDYIQVNEPSWAEYETNEAQPDRMQNIVRSSGLPPRVNELNVEEDRN